jgi:hypothetical protein
MELTRALGVSQSRASPTSEEGSSQAAPSAAESGLLEVRKAPSRPKTVPIDPMANAIPDPALHPHAVEADQGTEARSSIQALAGIQDLPGVREKQEVLESVSLACEQECSEETRFELFGLFHHFAQRGTEIDRMLARQTIDILRRNSAPSLELDRLAESVR